MNDNISPQTRTSCESRNGMKMPVNFINALDIDCKENPKILINRLDSSNANTPISISAMESTFLNRGQNTSGHALPSTMTFGDLSPDGAETVSPKRARAHTFNIDDGLIITKYPCETENENNLDSVEERKNTIGSDCNKN